MAFDTRIDACLHLGMLPVWEQTTFEIVKFRGQWWIERKKGRSQTQFRE